jgi:hypothetical protein
MVGEAMVAPAEKLNDAIVSGQRELRPASAKRIYRLACRVSALAGALVILAGHVDE